MLLLDNGTIDELVQKGKICLLGYKMKKGLAWINFFFCHLLVAKSRSRRSYFSPLCSCTCPGCHDGKK